MYDGDVWLPAAWEEIFAGIDWKAMSIAINIASNIAINIATTP